MYVKIEKVYAILTTLPQSLIIDNNTKDGKSKIEKTKRKFLDKIHLYIFVFRWYDLIFSFVLNAKINNAKKPIKTIIEYLKITSKEKCFRTGSNWSLIEVLFFSSWHDI